MQSLPIRAFSLAGAIALLAACSGSDGGAGEPTDDAGGDDARTDTLGVASDTLTTPDVPGDAPHDGAVETGVEASSDAPIGAPGLHVEGNKLVDGGKTIRLLGVNHSGGEYACVGGYGIVEGPSGTALIDPILSWKANVVRIPVNEQCWLGINGIDAKYSGDTYRKAIGDHVAAFRARGLYVILDLHWAAPGTTLAKMQLPMADADHAIDFWKSAAAAFKGDAGVIFDLFNEPYLTTSNADTSDPWACLLSGCTVKATSGAPSYKSAGMQQLVDAVRGTGARNVIMVAGLAYTNDLSKWLAHQPTDPAGQIAVSLHLYNFNACKDAGCWASWDPIIAAVPFVTGELGEDDCAHGFVDGFMTWADARGVSYLGWTWNTWDCKSGPALISGYDGTPTTFGTGFRDHLRSL
jgi:endoglucanase